MIKEIANLVKLNEAKTKLVYTCTETKTTKIKSDCVLGWGENIHTTD